VVSGSGPTTLITGGSKRVAAATAVRLARRGDRVVLVDNNEPWLAETADGIRATGGHVDTYALEMRDRGGLESMVADVGERLGGVTYLVSYTSGSREGHVSDLTLTDWQMVQDAHLSAAFHVCQTVLPRMLERRHGAIVLDSSDFAVVGLAGQAGFTAAKTALYGFAKALALECAPHGVRVNAIGSGLIEPHSYPGVPPETWEAHLPTLKDTIPMGRLGRPEEVASVVDFVLSDRASYITGQLLEPNGGRIMW
jgi:NAD(P)-dependent dehydrogenase (short-subunit alcohol dehydrogenase family)